MLVICFGPEIKRDAASLCHHVRVIMYDVYKLSTEIVSDAHVCLRHRTILHIHTRGERAFRGVEEIFGRKRKKFSISETDVSENNQMSLGVTSGLYGDRRDYSLLIY